MTGRRTLIGLTSPDVRTVPGETSRVTAHTRAPESAAAMVTAPATIEPITSKTPATRRKSNQLGVFTRRGEGEVVATCLGPVSARRWVDTCRFASATGRRRPRRSGRRRKQRAPGRDGPQTGPTRHCKTSRTSSLGGSRSARPERAKHHVIAKNRPSTCRAYLFLNVTDRRDLRIVDKPRAGQALCGQRVSALPSDPPYSTRPQASERR